MPLSFTSSGDYPIGDDPVALAVADLNGDGTPDIVTVNRHDGTISIVQGNRDGTFMGAATLAVGSLPASIAVADLNGDGAADLAIADKDDGTVSVLLENKHYFHPLVSTLGGRILIGFAAVWAVAGSLVIKKIVEIEV